MPGYVQAVFYLMALVVVVMLVAFAFAAAGVASAVAVPVVIAKTWAQARRGAHLWWQELQR